LVVPEFRFVENMGFTKYVPIVQRFPECYRRFLQELERPRTPVNWKPCPDRVWWDASQKKGFPVCDPPIPTTFPLESQRGLWGGEGVIKGFRRRKDKPGKVPTYWWPKVKSAVVYSEIFDKYLKLELTQSVLEKIDENYGFDMYILKTPVQDLNSQMAYDLRRKMILALINKDIYPNDEKKREEILKKYNEFLMPKEEAEWFGLSMREATWKLLEMEEKYIGVPRKIELRQKYFEMLQARVKKEAEENA